jgi:uncharacterized protein (TIGR03086 family)
MTGASPATEVPGPVESFVLADHGLNAVVQQITDDQWAMTMPAQFARMGAPDTPITLREVLNYHAYDEAWIPDMLAGATMAEVGPDTFDGDLLGDDPKVSFAALVAKGTAAAESLTDLDRIVHFSYGDFPAREGLWHVISFRGLRTVDLARVLGFDDTLDPGLVQAMWTEFEPQAEQWRAIGVFGPKVEVPDDAPLQQRLLGLTGRQPRA